LGVETRVDTDPITDEVKKIKEVITGKDNKGNDFVSDWGGKRGI